MLAPRRRIVAAPGAGVVDAQLEAPADDLRLGAVDEGRVEAELPPLLDAGPGGETGHALEGLQVLRPAVRVTRVVERVDRDEDVFGAEDLGGREREREEDGVPRRDVGDGDAARGDLVPGASARDRDPPIGE